MGRSHACCAVERDDVGRALAGERSRVTIADPPNQLDCLDLSALHSADLPRREDAQDPVAQFYVHRGEATEDVVSEWGGDGRLG